MSDEELTRMVDSPIPRDVKCEFCRKAGEVCTFINKIGAHGVIHVAAYRKGQHGQNYTVFYKE